MARFAAKELPIKVTTWAQVDDITTLEKGPNWVLHGKTDWQNPRKPDVGWWVDWVVRDESAK
ncbi:MAG TPA: hypothetical protein VIT91_19225 [Chthoniobacterales bacterium]